LQELNHLSELPDLWNDPERAQKIMRERNELDDRLSSLVKIEKDLNEHLELAEMGEAEGDSSIVDEAQAALAKLKDEVKQRQFEALFSGEADGNDTFIEINSGAGGTESQDWPICCCACIRAGASGTASRWS